MKKLTGTKEWADCNVNIQRGCENNCTYCYARKAALRRKQIKSEEDWKTPIFYDKKIRQIMNMRGKKSGIIMFPSTHDITERNITACIMIITKYLITEHRLLIVSKPRRDIIKKLIDQTAMKLYKNQVEFRFTIGTLNEDTRQIWEPDAPPITERLRALFYTLEMGFKCSVSCEPLLDPNCEIVTYLLEKQNTEREFAIWIGAMNYVKDAPKLDYIQIFHRFNENPYIKWKESFRKHLPISLQTEIENKWW